MAIDDGDLANPLSVVGHDARVNNWTTRVRGHVEWDARTQTDIGLIRAFIAMEGTRGPRGHVTRRHPSGGVGLRLGLRLASAFLQISNDWGTYTAGKFGSFFDFWGDHRFGTRIGIEPARPTRTSSPGRLLAETGSRSRCRLKIRTRSVAVAMAMTTTRAWKFPDGVANIRVDQGWGSAQIMGAVRHIHDVNGDGLGFAVGAGLGLNIPGGWRVRRAGGYSEGAIAYISV